ncbi:MAG: hypothetical protein KGL39_15405 [Patescibacteria group bacterium]|nr:hypothetical protein [Patescibacteria group bacterium]
MTTAKQRRLTAIERELRKIREELPQVLAARLTWWDAVASDEPVTVAAA